MSSAMTLAEGKLVGCGGTGTVTLAVLPMGIVEKGILCRLSVKQLLRCKSVCKLWYSVITDPKFFNNHYHHESNRNRPIFVQRFLSLNQQVPIAFRPGAPKSLPMMVNLGDGERGGGANLLFSYYLGLPWQRIFVRPVNGLLLVLLANGLADRCRMALFNPATRQFRQLIDFKFNTLSEPPKPLPNSIGNHIFGYGVCRNSTSTNPEAEAEAEAEVYKVVWLNVRPEERDVAVAKVFTVGGGEWRMINGALPRDFVMKYSNFPDKNISLNGKCYWLSRDFAHILVFDMEEEMFREMDSPVPSVYHSPPESSYNNKGKDAVFSEVQCCGEEGSSLALFVFESGFVDMSVMDKEEDWYWIRRIVTCIDRPISDLSNLQVLSQFPITDDSILVKAGRSSFAMYNPKTNRCVHFREPSPTNCTYGFVTVFNFKESLFSVDGGIQVSDRLLEDFSTF